MKPILKNLLYMTFTISDILAILLPISFLSSVYVAYVAGFIPLHFALKWLYLTITTLIFYRLSYKLLHISFIKAYVVLLGILFSVPFYLLFCLDLLEVRDLVEVAAEIDSENQKRFLEKEKNQFDDFDQVETETADKPLTAEEKKTKVYTDAFSSCVALYVTYKIIVLFIGLWNS